MWPKNETYASNFTGLKMEQEICSKDGIECGCCPVEEYCRMIWDSLQDVTEIHKSGIPDTYIKIYKNLLNKLRQKKHEKYNSLVLALRR